VRTNQDKDIEKEKAGLLRIETSIIGFMKPIVNLTLT